MAEYEKGLVEQKSYVDPFPYHCFVVAAYRKQAQREPEGKKLFSFQWKQKPAFLTIHLGH